MDKNHNFFPDLEKELDDLDWLGSEVPEFAGNKKESEDKELLFPKTHRELPENPTERDKFIERVHCDLDLDTTREILFVKDQYPQETYEVVNGALGGILTNGSEYSEKCIEDKAKEGANMKEIFQIFQKSDFLPTLTNESYETYDFQEQEKRLLTNVFEKNLLACTMYFSKFSKNPNEKLHEYGQNGLDKIRELIDKDTFNFSKYDYSPDLKRRLELLSDNHIDCGGRFYDQVSFFHITSPFGRGVDNIECRLYLSPQNTHIYDTVNSIVSEHYNMDVPKYYLKYTDDCRNDRIVIYTDFDHVNQELDVLNTVQRKHLELFEGMGRNPLWGNIDGAPKGVYFGEEPKEYGSYGSVRGDSFDDAFDRWLSSYGMKSEIKDPNSSWGTHRHQINFHHLEDITDDMVYRFVDFFKQELLEHDVDPNNPCINK